MITLSNVLACFAIIVLLAAVTLLIGAFISSAVDENFEFGGWLLSTIGFGVCLTIILIQNGIIK